MFHFVVCSCGKRLRAYEGMAEVRCPVCKQSLVPAHGTGGSPVPAGEPLAPRGDIIIFGFDPPPSLEQRVSLQYEVVEISNEVVPPAPGGYQELGSHDEDDGRPYPLERSWQKDPIPKVHEELWGADVDPARDRNPLWPERRNERKPRRAGRQVLEQTWFDCLSYPLRGWPVLAAIGLALTIATFGLLHVLRRDTAGAWSFCLIACVALAYFCGFLTCVLNAGAGGVIHDLHWPGLNVKILFRSLLVGVLSFLAGPIIPAVLAIYFWIYAGDLTAIDKLILLELTMATIGYWLLVFISAALGDHWNSLLPGAVIERVRELGIRTAAIAVVFVLGIFVFHAMLAIAGLSDDLSAMSFILLLLCWTSLLYWLIYLMRWLGICLYHRKMAARKASG